MMNGVSLLVRFFHCCAPLGLALAAASVQAQAVPAPAGAPAALHLRIVGGLAGVHQYNNNEEPFWRTQLAQLSQGKYSAEIVPFDRAGVPGADMLRLLELGVVPFGTALLSAMQTEYPVYAGVDLAGMNPNMASLKRSVAAFRPYFENHLRTQHQVQLLAIYVYPAQVLFCKRAFASLADLKGRNIRVSSVTQSDFFTALGAKPVITAFNQMVAQLRTGNLDCAVTGTMSGNTLGLPALTSHIHTMPITWGLAAFAANKNAWDSLPPDLRALLSAELPKLEAAIWTESELETAEGLACNTGASGCRTGLRAAMTAVRSSTRDEQLRREVFNNSVLPRWLQRCGARCQELWTQTNGFTTGSAR